MAVIGRFNHCRWSSTRSSGSISTVPSGEILLPRYVPKDQPSEVGDWLNVFIYLDSDDRLIATTRRPRSRSAVSPA